MQFKVLSLMLFQLFWIPYARHYNPLLIRNRSWILTIHKARILRKKPLEKTFLDFKKWVKSIQTAGYDGARTVLKFWFIKIANRTTYIQLLCVHACIECARNDGNNFLSIFLSVCMMSVQKWQGCYLELHYSHTCLISTDIGLCWLLSGCKNISLTHFCGFL